jgi:hypothetical protein
VTGVRSSILPGPPGGQYVVENGDRDAIVGSDYLIQSGAAIGAVAAAIDNLTLSAAASALVQGSLSATLDNLALSAVASAAVSASLDATIDDLTLDATGEVIVSGSLAATIEDLTLDAAGDVIVDGVLDTTIDDVILDAAAIVSGGSQPAPPPRRGGGLVWPLWFQEYVRRIEGEREIAREHLIEEQRVEGDFVATLWLPVVHGAGETFPPVDPEEEDLITTLAAQWLMAA